MDETSTEGIASDWIDEQTPLLFKANRLGNVACFFREELEHLLRHAYARGRQNMARQCAEAVHKSVAEVTTVPASSYPKDPTSPIPGKTLVDAENLLDRFTAWAMEAGKEEAEWG